MEITQVCLFKQARAKESALGKFVEANRALLKLEIERQGRSLRKKHGLQLRAGPSFSIPVGIQVRCEG